MRLRIGERRICTILFFFLPLRFDTISWHENINVPRDIAFYYPLPVTKDYFNALCFLNCLSNEESSLSKYFSEQDLTARCITYRVINKNIGRAERSATLT